MTDHDLVEQCRRGDTSAFDVIADRYGKRLYNVAVRFLGNREDALDICQEAFVRAYQSLDSYRGDARFYTWLYSIAANLARNRLRDRSRKGRDRGTSLDALFENAPAVANAAAAATRNPGTDAMEHEMEEVLQRCLEELPDHYRLPFVLRTFDDLSYEEIAEVMDCPPGTVKSRLNQARKRLRERLRDLAILEAE
ncbi:MAG TPA: sigma-70 family RNA polymerase sigma factor [Candidatus Hydrogenedentes bacterium]|jgi:RNA polymerase sigma-70 factor (ECF subfamily)|nr:sigma-70 family RNA polymerase sigma factor [Candidatus Hydrogenedentota bacterium]MDY0030442.1 sigma-70 family RNA polymerase sigma factor [FCB group bacterium]NLT62690.1 sigma-70 family RNA polymerase sigma factor [Candidatus Hydrogenedentota bacterium]HNV22131.1 sigma-70 family RNA polymerase sigma factor [Candidatus Hydrogenedentota bacterium]HNZ18767.1 sigma-70 family RNA polymerase sigma factor [Candidatus Hydrogenedentota bacterium]